jgi:formylglycine-generating enzyme required for sulfatase activity
VITYIKYKGIYIDDIPYANPGLKLIDTKVCGDTVTETYEYNLIPLVYIPAGEFLMGSSEFDSDADAYKYEKPQHLVKVSSFYMGRYPVTQAQWQTVMGNNPSNFKGDDHPVEKVSWHDAVAFCQRLSEQTSKEYRLPTEAEWEYACRAGTTTKYYFGEDANQLSEYAWYSQNAGSKTHPVGQKQPNQFGLYDLYGNVWEWCLDNWHENYADAPADGSAWSESNTKMNILRGGSWFNPLIYCRSAYRSWNLATNRFNYCGFRVVCASN